MATASPQQHDALKGLRRPTTVLAGEGDGRVWPTLARDFDDLGLQIESHSSGAIAAGDTELVWVWGAAGWYRRQLRSLARMSPHARPTVLLWHSEPLPMPVAAGLPRQPLHARELAKVLLRNRRVADPQSNLRRLVRLVRSGLPDLLVVTSEGARETLSEYGIVAHVVPLGVNARDWRDLGLDRDIDVVFIGALDVPRRKRLLRTLRAAGIDVAAFGSWREPQLWGEKRTELLNRARIVLNLSRFPGQYSGLRLAVTMGNGALVVSEPMYRPHPFVPSEHYVSAAIEEMPAVIARLLERDDERAEIAERGRRLATEELTLQRSFARIAELVEAHSPREG